MQRPTTSIHKPMWSGSATSDPKRCPSSMSSGGDVWPDVRCYTDYRELLEREQPDIVSVVTPDHLHADITVEAAHGSARAVLCEKPIATRLADADRMIEVTAREGVLLSVEHTRRWSHEFHLVRQLIRSGTYGSLHNIVANLYGPRAMLFRNGTHTVDMICFFAEASPAWLTAVLEPGTGVRGVRGISGRRGPRSGLRTGSQCLHPIRQRSAGLLQQCQVELHRHAVGAAVGRCQN